MNPLDLLGRTFSCACGKDHKVPTEGFFYGKDAFQKIARTLRDIAGTHCSCLLVADTRTYEAAGKRVEKVLEVSGMVPALFIVPDGIDGTPVADDHTKADLLDHAPQADVYIAVGSGVINDLVKWVAFLRERPYVTVPTAASMNGYASANVAATVDGLKVLFHAEACRAVFADPEILTNAPYELTASGLGDVLAKPVSTADWKLNQFLFQDYYCQFSVDLLKELEPVYLNNPEGINKGEAQAIRALFEALLYSSIAMTITGTSAPASGGEHLVSHTLDMLAGRDGRTHDLHGRQVGVATILMAALYEKTFEIDTPKPVSVPKEINTQFWGALSPIIEKEYAKKYVKFEKVASLLAVEGNWGKLKAIIQPQMVSAAQLKTCLSKAGAAHRYCDIRDNGKPLKREKFLQIVQYGNQMRERFTILDLATLLGVIPDELGQLVDSYVKE